MDETKIEIQARICSHCYDDHLSTTYCREYGEKLEQAVREAFFVLVNWPNKNPNPWLEKHGELVDDE